MARRKYVKENNLVKAINTDSLELQKPLVNEYYDINVHNSNMDKIDLGYKQNKNDISDIKNELSKTENTKYTTANGIKEFSCKDGYVDNVVIEGETLVNLYPIDSSISVWDSNKLANDLRVLLMDRASNGKFTVANCTNKVVCVDIGVAESGSWKRVERISANSSKVIEISQSECILNHHGLFVDGWEDTDASKTEFKKSIVILEGDHTNKPISYFEGLKSVGQGDKIEVLTYQGENLFDGTYDIGYFNSVVGGYIENLATDVPTKTTKWIACKPNTLYHLIGGNRGSVQIKNNNTIIDYKGDYETQIVTPSECTHFRVYYERVGQFSLPFRIIEGKQDEKQILTTLRSLPNGVKDTIEKRGNKYYKIKRCVECNPREITYFGGKGTYCQIELKISDLPQIANNSIISNLFGNFGNTGGSKDTVFIHPTYEKIIVIQTTNPSITTKELAQTYIENNNFTVVYELATPVIEELPNFNPQTFSDKTTLLLNSGVVQAEASFEVTNSLGSELEVLKGKVSNLGDYVVDAIEENKTSILNIEEDYLSFVRKYNDEKFIQHYQVGSDGDFNNLVESGFYKIQTTTTNLPNGAYQYGMLLVFRYTRDNEKRTIQIYIPNTSNSSSGGIYTRSYNSGGWTSWFKSGTPIATLSNLEVQISELEIQLLESEV